MSNEKPAKSSAEIEPPRSAAGPQRFTTVSGHSIRQLYTPADLANWDPERDLGQPGEPPYTRGIHPTMYRGRLWTMRQFAGFGTCRGHQRSFPLLACAGPDRTFRRFRPANSYGLRLRPSAFARRSRQMRGSDKFAGGYGSALRPNSAGRRHHVDDNQFSRRDYLGDVSGRGRKARRGLEPSCQARSRMTFSRNISRRRSTSIRPSRRCAW